MKNRTQYLKWGLTAFLTVCAVLVFLRHILYGRYTAAVREKADLRAGAGGIRRGHRIPADAGDELDREGAPRCVAEGFSQKST
ncbi:MAG: hypothetical protein ACLR54_02425 [Oscillospiraceae bacterium]